MILRCSLALFGLLLLGCSDDPDSIPCSDPPPTGCYEFNGSCTPVDARCVDDRWVCTTPADYAEMMIACETGLVFDGGL